MSPGADPPRADLLAAIVQGVGEGITVQDRSGRLVFANRLGAELTGFSSPEELMAAGPERALAGFELFDEEGRPFPLANLPGRALFRGDPPSEVTLRFRSKADGAERWSIVRAMPILDPAGQVELVLHTFRDVTKKRQHAEAAREAQEWLSTVLRSIGDAVIATDREGRVRFLNPVAEQLTGWTEAEAGGRHLREVFVIVDEHHRHPVESPVERVIRENTVVGLANHTLLLRRDGTEVAIDDSAAPIRGSDGELRGVVLVFRDVTERRRAELRRAFLGRATEELNRSLDYAQTLATVARLAVPTIADWCAVDILEQGEVRRLGVAHVDPEKVALVEEIQRRWPVDPKDSGTRRILRTGKTEIVSDIPDELLVRAAKDPEHLASLRRLQLHSFVGVPLRRMDEPVGVITFAFAESGRRHTEEDVALAEALADKAGVAIERARVFSEHVEARRLLEAARADAERASRSKDEFLAMLGHELRNPLAPIRTALQVMKLRGSEDHTAEREVIERQLEHVVRLVDDLLDISRITRGTVELSLQRVELADVVTLAREMTSPLFERRPGQLSVAVPRGLEVRGDPVRLAQVVANLLSNAAKYTPAAGRIEVIGAREGAQVALRVRDEGVGIDPDLLPRVFDLFVQGEQSMDRAAGGLGLGLAITRRLVEAHGGTVTAESPGAGKGSTFTVRLPAHDAAIDPDPPPVAPADPGPAPVRVVVVDDNEDALTMLAHALRLVGHEVHTAKDGPEALGVVDAVRPDVALVDIGLPGMDGYEVARRLRASPDLARTRLVALTGYGSSADQARARDAGFDAHLTKPASLEEVEETIASLTQGA